MIFELKEEHIFAGEANHTYEYIEQRKRELCKSSIFYIGGSDSYPGFLKAGNEPKPDELLVFCGPESRSDILVYIEETSDV